MSPWHWALVIAVGILLFGAKRLPDAARSLGRSARILKAELRGDEPESATPDPVPPTSAGQAQPDRTGPRRNTPPPTT